MWQRSVLRLFHLHQDIALWLCSVLFVAVSAADLAAPPALNLSLLFVFIVVLAAWNLGWKWGVAFATGGCVVQYVSLLSHPAETLYTLIWFGWVANRCLILFVVVGLAHPLKLLFDRHAAAARIDSLTGAANHKHFHEALEAEVSRGLRSGQSFAVALLDCDDFKLVNDQFGHRVGDKVLRSIVDAAGKSTRRSDVVARIGGDEFAVLLAGAKASDALEVMRRFRATMEREHGAHPWPSTVSIGLASFDSGRIDADSIMSICDALMYRAKRSGKGRIVHEHVNPASMPQGVASPYGTK